MTKMLVFGRHIFECFIGTVEEMTGNEENENDATQFVDWTIVHVQRLNPEAAGLSSRAAV